MSSIIATIISDSRKAVIADALQSAINWVDRVVLIDTEIRDETTKIAALIAGDRLIVEQFPWCNDFAAARNFALAAAKRHGATWALTLDTDERLEFSRFRSRDELLKTLNADSRIRSWFVFSKDGSYSKERFIHVGNTNHQPLLWKGRTHEFLSGARQHERATLTGVVVAELRKTKEQMKAKLLRDLAILKEETTAKPAEPRWWYYLGQTYDGLEQPDEAIDAFRRCAAIRTSWSEQAAWACYRAASCCLHVGKHDDALELCGLGIARQPESPELAWLAGYVCYRLGRMRQAVTWSQISAGLGAFRGNNVGDRRISFRHLPAWYEGPYDVLRYAHRSLGENLRAEENEALYLEARAARTKKWSRTENPHNTGPSASIEFTGRDHERICDVVPKTPDSTERENVSHPKTTRVAVLGLYSSGSSATAAMLHELGVALGHDVNREYFEPIWLSRQLRVWWKEPDLIEQISRGERIDALRTWIENMDRASSSVIGAKHPLLLLCGSDLVSAWGADTKFIWTWRALHDSVASLKRRAWWPGLEERIQNHLWQAAETFFADNQHLVIRFDDVLSNPSREVDRMIEYLQLVPTAEQIRNACAAIRLKASIVS